MDFDPSGQLSIRAATVNRYPLSRSDGLACRAIEKVGALSDYGQALANGHVGRPRTCLVLMEAVTNGGVRDDAQVARLVSEVVKAEMQELREWMLATWPDPTPLGPPTPGRAGPDTAASCGPGMITAASVQNVANVSPLGAQHQSQGALIRGGQSARSLPSDLHQSTGRSAPQRTTTPQSAQRERSYQRKKSMADEIVQIALRSTPKGRRPSFLDQATGGHRRNADDVREEDWQPRLLANFRSMLQVEESHPTYDIPKDGLARIAGSDWFGLLVAFFILANSILIGVEVEVGMHGVLKFPPDEKPPEFFAVVNN
eukprot:2772999-Amphidinium_carterae.1